MAEGLTDHVRMAGILRRGLQRVNVPVSQQARASLHRIRATWQTTRTMRLNIPRGLLREFSVTIPAGAHHVVPRVRELVEDADAPLPRSLRPTLAELCEEIHTLESRICGVERQLAALAGQLSQVARLRTIPGVGLLVATALVACVGDVRRLHSGRRFASYLGLTPKEHSSGTRRRLGAISKQGDRHLRMLMIHGARSVLWNAKARSAPDAFCAWALDVERRRGLLREESRYAL